MKIKDVAWKTILERWTIEMGGEKGSERFVLAAQHDIYIYILYVLKDKMYTVVRANTWTSSCTMTALKRSVYHISHTGGCPRVVMDKTMNGGIVVSEFVLQSRYYVHFRPNTLGKGMNPLILPPAMGK